jgi:hypothetical protein
MIDPTTSRSQEFERCTLVPSSRARSEVFVNSTWIRSLAASLERRQ